MLLGPIDRHGLGSVDTPFAPSRVLEALQTLKLSRPDFETEIFKNENSEISRYGFLQAQTELEAHIW